MHNDFKTRFAVCAAVVSLLAACGGGGGGDGGTSAAPTDPGAGGTPSATITITGADHAFGGTRYVYTANSTSTPAAVSWDWGDGSTSTSAGNTQAKTWHRAGAHAVAVSGTVGGAAGTGNLAVTTIGQVLAMGDSHTCGIKADQTVLCWGSDAHGQLGNGAAVSAAQRTPVAVTGLTEVIQIAAGAEHACALRADGTVWCWGRNQYGQAGNDTVDRAAPAAVAGVSGAVALGVGTNTSCAIKSDGTAWCWGRNNDGVLGDGSSNNSATPVAVAGLSDAVAIAPGYQQNCALTAAGAVLCWGSNGFGQLGDGSTAAHVAPATVTGLGSGVVAIATGVWHVCALKTDGGVACWGHGSVGEIGNGANLSQTTPQTVSGLTDAIALVSTGGYSMCALRATGALACWGANSYGELGDGTSAVARNTPVAAAVSGIVALGSGSSNLNGHMCALKDEGSAQCWGYGNAGQLGDGVTIDTALVPVAVSGGTQFWH